MEIFYCSDVRGGTEEGKGLEIVQKQETLLGLGQMNCECKNYLLRFETIWEGD